MEKNQRYLQAKKVTLVGATMNVFLGILKTLGGIVFHSHGLIADGIHSFSDLITDAMVLLASKYSNQDADTGHPYGHQRIETAATMFLAILLIIAGGGIAWDSILEIWHKQHDIPGLLTLPLIGISILVNEILYRYTLKIGKQIQSSLIIANAWHHRSDAASSVVVLLGLIGSFAGFHFFDPLAAIIVGCMIIKMGLNYGWNSLKELVDTAADSATLAEIENIIDQVDGVKKIHQLRTRLMAGDVYIDVHILVNSKISVSEGHYIAQHVHRKLITQLPQIKDVIIHVDSEDDELSCPSFNLPNRRVLEQNLFENWQKSFPELESWVIHYLDGKISIDLFFHNNFEQWKEIKNHIFTDLMQYPLISQIRLLTHHESLVINSADSQQ